MRKFYRNILHKLGLIKPDEPPTTYFEELNRQCNVAIIPAAFVGIIAWIPYLQTDAELYPEITVLPLLRLGLTAVSVLAVILMFTPFFRGKGYHLWMMLAGYVLVATGIITGLVGADSSYMAGYNVVILLIVIAPFARLHSYVLLFSSLLAFAVVSYASGVSIDSYHAQYDFNNLAAAVGIAMLFIFLLDKIRHNVFSQNLEIQKQKQKSDHLLLNILPGPVAEELKQKGTVEARYYPSVTVVFTDLVNFTRISEGMTPQELVQELDRIFSYFDMVVEKYNLEKIKTIGDGYLFGGGIPEENETHTVDAILASLEIQRYIEKLSDLRESQDLPSWKIRLGIHTGPLVAGIVGEKKFAYDIWGDTVNVASRMQSAGDPGRINITQATYETIKDYFSIEHRGQIEVKNKGMMDMYYVNGINEHLQQAGSPNDLFVKRYNQIGGQGGSEQFEEIQDRQDRKYTD